MLQFDAERRRLDLRIDFPKGARFPCPECGRADCPVHDTEPHTWRHLNFFQHEAYLHARVPRVKCPEHGVKQVQVPWARGRSDFTLLFEALVMALVKEMPVKAIARLVGRARHEDLAGRAPLRRSGGRGAGPRGDEGAGDR